MIVILKVPAKEIYLAAEVAVSFSAKGYRKLRPNHKVKFGKFTAHNTRTGNIVILPK